MKPPKLNILIDEPQLEDEAPKKKSATLAEPAASTTQPRRTGRNLLDLVISGAAAARRERPI